jgi:tetratricopeptide (TPR) repeat protein
MPGTSRAGWRAVALIAVVGAASPLARAQQSRLHTLTYEKDKREWTEVAPPRPGTSEGDLYLIRKSIRDRAFGRALGQIKSFLKKHGADDPLHPEVLIAQAEAQIGRRDFVAAHDTLQSFLASYRGTAATSDAIRLEVVIAESFLGGAKRKLWGMPLLSGEDLALQILGEISTDNPDNHYAELALKTKADYLFRTGDHALAELEYNRLLREYPSSRYHEYALRRAAEGALASFAGVYYDDAALVEAGERFEEYRTAYPAQADRDGVALVLDSIREMRADKEFLIGQYYEKTDHLSSAAFCYKNVRQDWPDTVAAAKATRRLELLGVLEVVAPPDRDRAVPGP